MRLRAIIAALALTTILAVPTFAAAKMTCSAAVVERSVTLTLTGANGVEVDLTWYFINAANPLPGQNNPNLTIYYDVDAPNSGKFTTTQTFDVPGTGYIVATGPRAACSALFVVP